MKVRGGKVGIERSSTTKQIRRIDVEAVGRPLLGHPQAVVAHPYVFLSGQMATDYVTGVVPESGRSKPQTPYWEQRMKGQAARVIENTRAVLNEAGTDLEKVVKVVSFHTDLRELPISMETRTKYFPSASAPGSTAVGIAGLPVDDAGFQFEAIGFIPGDGLDRQSIFMDQSQVLSVSGESERRVFANAVVAGDLVFTQGSIAGLGGQFQETASARSAFAHYESEIKNQTVLVLRKLGPMLEAAGSSLEDVVKADCWLVAPHLYPGMDEAFREVFPHDPPARSVAIVRELVVRDALIEISVVAVRRGGAARKVVVNAPDAPPPLGHESHAVRAGNLLFTSSLISRHRQDPALAGLPHIAAAEAEAGEAIAAAKAILRAGGSDLRAIAR
jgi:enamine deaminase RidA (YjgF/YER057c/UK114 family)